MPFFRVLFCPVLSRRCPVCALLPRPALSGSFLSLCPSSALCSVWLFPGAVLSLCPSFVPYSVWFCPSGLFRCSSRLVNQSALHCLVFLYRADRFLQNPFLPYSASLYCLSRSLWIFSICCCFTRSDTCEYGYNIL